MSKAKESDIFSGRESFSMGTIVFGLLSCPVAVVSLFRGRKATEKLIKQAREPQVLILY